MFWFQCLKLFVKSLAVKKISENISRELFVTCVSYNIITIDKKRFVVPNASCFLWFEFGVGEFCFNAYSNCCS